MNKIAIFILVAILFSAVSAVADTTYVCSEVGDWDQWNVTYAQQKELVGKDIVMEITDHGDGTYDIIAYYSYDPQNYLNICKDKYDCDTSCEPGDYPYNCPCATCSAVKDVVAVVTYILSW